MDKPPPRALPMVHWFDPGQLVRTGSKVLIATILGSQIDYRKLEALQQPQGTLDYTCVDDASGTDTRAEGIQRRELWFDYVADLGDGWRPTFAVASLLAQESLTVFVDEDSAATDELSRGRLLIMGGDQVYPVASRENYEQRLVAPYQTALPSSDEPPDLFAIPGNHDWYDGLVSFMRLFCQERWIGGWHTRQKRSYFALRLPHNWWLWAVDIQLGADIDQPQLEYFRAQAEQFEPNARVILCTPVPDWIYQTGEKSNLEYLEEKLIEEKNAKLYVTVAGDLHHYRRHQNAECSSVQKLTCGGGGAFLSPTHGPDVETLQFSRSEKTETYSLETAFPDEATSRKLAWRTLLFPWLNPKFGVLTAMVYLLTNWLLPPQVAQLPRTPSILLWGGLLVILCIAYARGKVFRVVGGTLHGLCHLAAASLLAYGCRSMIETPSELADWWLGNLVMLCGGYLAGPTIMGVYLLIALNLFHQHPNEAFAAIRVQDYKSFLRFHITPEGELRIYPVGLERVQDDVPLLKPRLIEPAIHIKPSVEATQKAT